MKEIQRGGEKCTVMGFIMKGREGEDEDMGQGNTWRC